MAKLNSNFICSLIACCFFIIVCVVLLSVLIPIGVLNSLPPQYCYSTDHLKYLPIGSVITMQKDIVMSRFHIYNSTKTEVENRVGRMKYRSWAIPYRIDLMTANEEGSCEGKGNIFSIGQIVDLYACQNDSSVPFTTFGKIDQELTILLRKYNLFNPSHTLVAYAEENFTILNAEFDIKSPDGKLVYARVVSKPFSSIYETWEITVKIDLPDFYWRMVMYLISVVSYNKKLSWGIDSNK